MKFKTLLIITALIYFITGMLCMLFPAELLVMYGIILPPMGLVIYQFWGSALLGMGMLSWSVRNTESARLQKNIALSLFTANTTGFIMAIRGQFEGANASGWSTVLLYLLLTLGFAVFLIRKSGSKK